MFYIYNYICNEAQIQSHLLKAMYLYHTTCPLHGLGQGNFEGKFMDVKHYSCQTLLLKLQVEMVAEASRDLSHTCLVHCLLLLTLWLFWVYHMHFPLAYSFQLATEEGS